MQELEDMLNTVSQENAKLDLQKDGLLVDIKQGEDSLKEAEDSLSQVLGKVGNVTPWIQEFVAWYEYCTRPLLCLMST